MVSSDALVLLTVFVLRGGNAGRVTRSVNWDIFLFMIRIFLVITGLRNAGLVEFLAQALLLFKDDLLLTVLFVSGLVTVLASVMNNWSMTMIGIVAIGELRGRVSDGVCTALVFGNVIGNNLGPRVTPLGSLAMLMWFATMSRKGVSVSYWTFLKVGSVLSIFQILFAALTLYVELLVFPPLPIT